MAQPDIQGVPEKTCFLFRRDVAPPIFELGSNVGGGPESSQVDASFAYNSYSVASNMPEIFEFKVDCLQK